MVDQRQYLTRFGPCRLARRIERWPDDTGGCAAHSLSRPLIRFCAIRFRKAGPIRHAFFVPKFGLSHHHDDQSRRRGGGPCSAAVFLGLSSTPVTAEAVGGTCLPRIIGNAGSGWISGHLSPPYRESCNGITPPAGPSLRRPVSEKDDGVSRPWRVPSCSPRASRRMYPIDRGEARNGGWL